MANNCNKTPKKLVKHSPNDTCRMCKCNLKIEYGAARVSYENLFKPSERKESKGLLLLRACEIGLPVQKLPLLSERICRPCGRKIRNVYENFTFLKDNLGNSECDQTESPVRHNRELPSTLTPERQSRMSGTTKVKEPLVENEGNYLLIHAHVDRLTGDEIHNLMNIDTITPNVQVSQVCVMIIYPNSRIVLKELFDKHTSSLIKNVTLANCCEYCVLACQYPRSYTKMCGKRSEHGVSCAEF